MTRKKLIQPDFDIPDYQIESLARVLLPQIRAYLLSEQGQKDYAEWSASRQLNTNLNNNLSL